MRGRERAVASSASSSQPPRPQTGDRGGRMLGEELDEHPSELLLREESQFDVSLLPDANGALDLSGGRVPGQNGQLDHAYAAQEVVIEVSEVAIGRGSAAFGGASGGDRI